MGPDEAAGNHLVAFDGQNVGVHDDISGTLDTGGAHQNRGMHVAMCLNTRAWGRQDPSGETLIPTNGGVFDDAVPFDTTQITSKANRSAPKPGDPCHPLAAHAHAHAPALAFNARQDPINGPINGPIDTDGSTNGVLTFQERGRDGGRSLELGGDLAYALTAPGDGGRSQERNVLQGTAVRRLMPVECERLQGFPDGYTAIAWRGTPAEQCPDGPRYKALGNSWAVNCARWIGMRIAIVDALRVDQDAA